VIIALYKNRKKQIALSYLTIGIVLGYSFWLLKVTKEIIGGIQLKPDNYGIGILLPSLTILLLVFAIKGIRNDEKLIKSSERLRG
jgi:predicted branched-subunit amino acid permease